MLRDSHSLGDLSKFLRTGAQGIGHPFIGGANNGIPGSGQAAQQTNSYHFGATASVSTRQETADGVLRLVPFFAPGGVSYDRIGINVTIAGSAGALYRLGIYAADANDWPDGLITDAGTTDVTTTGVKFTSISWTPNPGLYYLAAANQGAPVTRPTVSSSFGICHGLTSTTFANVAANRVAFLDSSITGALPSSFAGVPSGLCIRVGVRAAS